MRSLRGARTKCHWCKNRRLSTAAIPMILGLVGALSGCASDQRQGLVENCLSDVACLEFAAATSSLWLPLVEPSAGDGSANTNYPDVSENARQPR